MFHIAAVITTIITNDVAPVWPRSSVGRATVIKSHIVGFISCCSQGLCSSPCVSISLFPHPNSPNWSQFFSSVLCKRLKRVARVVFRNKYLSLFGINCKKSEYQKLVQCGKVIRCYHDVLSYYKFVLVAQGTEGTQGSPGAQGNPGAEVGCPVIFCLLFMFIVQTIAISMKHRKIIVNLGT